MNAAEGCILCKNDRLRKGREKIWKQSRNCLRVFNGEAGTTVKSTNKQKTLEITQLKSSPQQKRQASGASFHTQAVLWEASLWGSAPPSLQTWSESVQISMRPSVKKNPMHLAGAIKHSTISKASVFAEPMPATSCKQLETTHVTYIIYLYLHCAVCKNILHTTLSFHAFTPTYLTKHLFFEICR